MTTGLFDLDGGADPELTGIESRTLRAMLQLERRHVAILAETVGEKDVTTGRVTQWERSKGRGYPPALVDLLRSIHLATSELAGNLAKSARDAAATSPGGKALLSRPRGSGRIMYLLRLPDVGIRFSPEAFERLEEGGGDFWQRLCDVATVQAALQLAQEGDWPIHVEEGDAQDPFRDPSDLSTLDDWLDEEGVRAEASMAAVKTVIAHQLGQAIEREGVTMSALASDLGTSRAQLARVLAPEGGNVTLSTLNRLAIRLGLQLRVTLD